MNPEFSMSHPSIEKVDSVASYNQGRLGKDYFYNTVFYQAEQTNRWYLLAICKTRMNLRNPSASFVQ